MSARSTFFRLAAKAGILFGALFFSANRGSSAR